MYPVEETQTIVSFYTERATISEHLAAGIVLLQSSSKQTCTPLSLFASMRFELHCWSALKEMKVSQCNPKVTLDHVWCKIVDFWTVYLECAVNLFSMLSCWCLGFSQKDGTIRSWKTRKSVIICEELIFTATLCFIDNWISQWNSIYGVMESSKI